jgi:hypothetical protein
MAVELAKINPSCRVVELIDSNSCIGDSLSKINDVFNTIKVTENSMISELAARKDTLSLFHGVSSKMISTALLIKSIDNVMKAPYTTIKALSSKWESKEFTLYYPEIFEVRSYYDNRANYEYIVLSWLNQSFSSEKFPQNQTINIYISLYYINYFDFSFTGSYLENCSPTAHGENTLSCNGCGNDNRNAGCNVKGQGCRNAYSYCGSSQTSQSNRYSCLGTIGSTYIYDSIFEPRIYDTGNTGFLNINYKVPNVEDMFLARIVKMKAKNNYGWSILE